MWPREASASEHARSIGNPTHGTQNIRHDPDSVSRATCDQAVRGCNRSGVDPPLLLQPRLPHGLHCHLSSLCALSAIGLVFGPQGSKSVPPQLGSGLWAQRCSALAPRHTFSEVVTRGLLPARARSGGGGGGLLQTPKWLYGTIGFVGARDFVLGIRQGEFFLLDLMCLYSKYSEFGGEFKNG